MASIGTQDREPWRSAAVLVGLVFLCLAAGAIGGWVTRPAVEDWYPDLAKPWFTPPGWAFAPVWTTLYVAMAIAAWLAWRSPDRVRAQDALYLFAIQLGFNLGWSMLFFGTRAIGLALVEILALLVAIAATMHAFWQLDRRAGLLMLPYLAWVGYAMALNAAIWWMN